MQTVSEVMTRDIRFVTPHESLQRAAQLMDELNVGALPVCDEEQLVGMVTDRDITVRAIAAGRNPQEAHVDEVMSTNVRWCFDDQPLDDVLNQMADSQVRRIPVLSHDSEHKLVGIISLGDVVTKTRDDSLAQDAQQVVERVSSPSEPHPTGDEPATASEGDGSTGTKGVAGSGTAGGTEVKDPSAKENTTAAGNAGLPGAPDEFGQTGDYSR